MTFLEVLQRIDECHKKGIQIKGFKRTYKKWGTLLERHLSGWFGVSRDEVMYPTPDNVVKGQCVDPDLYVVDSVDVELDVYDYPQANCTYAENVITWEDIVAPNWEEL